MSVLSIVQDNWQQRSKIYQQCSETAAVL